MLALTCYKFSFIFSGCFISPVGAVGGWIDDKPLVTVNKQKLLVQGAGGDELSRPASDETAAEKDSFHNNVLHSLKLPLVRFESQKLVAQK